MAVNINVFLELIEKGEKLENKTEESQEFQRWCFICLQLIGSFFGDRSDEKLAFLRVKNFDGKMFLLRSLYEKNEERKRTTPTTPSLTTTINVTQHQVTSVSVHNELSLQIILNIENSDELTEEEKAEVKKLYEEVSAEVQKPETNWAKVRNLLKRSFDYGLKIAPDIVKLADAYFKSKGTK